MNAFQLTAIVSLAIGAPVIAQEGVREKIHDLKAKAEAAQAEGRAEEAEKLRNTARELAERAQSQNGKREGEPREGPNRAKMQAMLEQTRRDLDEASREGRMEQAAELKHRITRLTSALSDNEEAKGDRPEKHGKVQPAAASEPHRRLQHLSEAIEHLRAAGMNEAAERLTEQAHAMKRQIAASPGVHRGEAAPGMEQQFAQLREGMMNLQRQMQEMQKRLEELSRERK